MFFRCQSPFKNSAQDVSAKGGQRLSIRRFYSTQPCTGYTHTFSPSRLLKHGNGAGGWETVRSASGSSSDTRKIKTSIHHSSLVMLASASSPTPSAASIEVSDAVTIGAQADNVAALDPSRIENVTSSSAIMDKLMQIYHAGDASLVSHHVSSAWPILKVSRIPPSNAQAYQSGAHVSHSLSCFSCGCFSSPDTRSSGVGTRRIGFTLVGHNPMLHFSIASGSDAHQHIRSS